MTRATSAVLLMSDEAAGLYDLIAELTGHAPESVFAWDGTDDPADPRTAALAKLYHACGKRIPDNLAVA